VIVKLDDRKRRTSRDEDHSPRPATGNQCSLGITWRLIRGFAHRLRYAPIAKSQRDDALISVTRPHVNYDGGDSRSPKHWFLTQL
jgi:hypothetical protein